MRRLTAKDLVGAANRAMLSFFVVDPSGLHDRAGQVAATDVSILQGETTWTTAAKMKAQDRLDDYRRWLADETGGFAVLNTNDMDRAMSRIKADASQYYLLGYYPVTTPKPGSAHTLTVQSRRPGVSVRTRKGYSVPRVAATSPLSAVGDERAANAAAGPGVSGSPAIGPVHRDRVGR